MKDNSGISRYYERLLQNQHGNTYYVTPKDTCPLSILNEKQRFVALTFDKTDDYIVIANKRYYLNQHNSIKGTANLQQRYAIVDLHELAAGKSYKFDEKFKHEYTAIYASFDELKTIAAKQFEVNGLPYFKQVANYDANTKQCRYVYEPSFGTTVYA